MPANLERRVAKLEQQRPDNPLDHLTEKELIEYEAYLDAKLLELGIVEPVASNASG